MKNIWEQYYDRSAFREGMASSFDLFGEGSSFKNKYRESEITFATKSIYSYFSEVSRYLNESAKHFALRYAKGKWTKKPDTSSGEKTAECREIEQTVAALIHEKFHAGPLPDPETLKEYNDILPDAAERIFNMAEKAQEHHHTMGAKLVACEVKKVNKGQNYALIIALVGIVGAVICAFLDQVTIGSIIGGSTLVSLASSFLYEKHKKSKEDGKKQPNSKILSKGSEKNEGGEIPPPDSPTDN
jgi:uncharacterized membrane protein